MDKPVVAMHTMENYSVRKRNKVLTYTTTWIDFDNSAEGKKPDTKSHTLPFI